MKKKLKVTLSDGTESTIVITTDNNTSWEDEFIEKAGTMLREFDNVTSVKEV